MHAIFSVMLYARCNRITYLHTSIASVEHNDLADEFWAEKWEQTFSPGYAELQLSAFDLRRVRVVPADTMMFEHPEPQPGEPVLLVASECHWYADSHPDFYSLIQPQLIRKYQRNCHPERAGNGTLFVAVHVRRGDVGEHYLAERFTYNSTVLNQIDQLSRALTSVPHEIHVFSEGREEDFGEIRDRAVMHLNGDVFECLHSLITADILVMAKSSFSYTAALLSRGIVIYSPFWHAPLQQWIVAGRDGSLPESQFGSALSRKLLERSSRRQAGALDPIS
jgi:hypothetical protein